MFKTIRLRYGIAYLILATLIIMPVAAQTPQPTVPLPFSPQAAPAASTLDPLSVALLTFLGAIVAGATGYIGAWFKRRTDAEATKVIVEAKAAETKAEINKKAQAVKDDLETQATEDRKQVRELFKEKVDELKLELRELRESTKLEIDGLRKEVGEAKQKTKTQTRITSTLQAENMQLRKDVDHMPQEIARLEALLEKKGNGDGQGTSKSVLDAGSEARVDAAKDDESP